jgi:TonB-linked SusC/RagA family outer membrane protein
MALNKLYGLFLIIIWQNSINISLDNCLYLINYKPTNYFNMKRIFYLKFFCLFFFTASVFGAYAQTKQVKGKVTDEGNLSLPGASVSIVGGNQITLTDAKGEFTINVPADNAIIRVSFLGMISKDVSVAGKTYITISLAESASKLNEVVVVGYGTVKRRDLTGAVASISGDELLEVAPITVNQALQGRLAGVEVQSNDGAPGAGVSIQIRGANSFSSSSEPLYVIDGIPFTGASTPANGAQGTVDVGQTINPLATLNPNDIESIEVLKDASSTAIYGSRGANGVVLITTKKGKAGQQKLEFSSNTTHSRVIRKIPVLNAADYARFQNEATANQNFYEGSNRIIPFRGVDFIDGITGEAMRNPSPEDFENGFNGGGTNWQDQIFRTATTQDYSLRVSGGSDKGTHAFSGSYVDQPGTIVGSGFKRLGGQVNIVSKVHDWIEVGTSTNISRTTFNLSKTNADNFAGNVLNSALRFPSTLPLFDEKSESGFSQLDFFSANPHTYVRQAKDVTNSIGLYSSSYIQINLPKNITFRQNVGLNLNQNSRSSYYGRLLREGRDVKGKASRGDNSWQGYTLESILSYNKTFNKSHNLNATGVFAHESGTSQFKTITAQNFPTDILQDNSLQTAIDPPVVRSGINSNALLSFLGRVNYNYKSKYYVTAAVRRDGSSKFAEANKFGTFPSVALAWTVTEEDFANNLPVISNLKIRTSFGQTGNQSIAPYATLPRLDLANAVVNGVIQSGFANGNPVDPNLKWETTTSYDIGLDFGFLNNRLSFTVDVYQKNTTDLLQNLLLPTSTGSANISTNSANITNRGLEMSLSGLIINKKDFSWTSNGNISFNRNEIGGLTGDQFARRLWSGIDQVFLQRSGYPIGTIFGYVGDGFYDNEAEVRADPAWAGASNSVIRSMIGERKYKDLDGDPSSITIKDRQIIGDTNPDYTFGITNTFTYKKFNLSVFLQGVQGRDIVNSNLLQITMGQIANIPQAAWDNRWTPTNTANAQFPKPNTSFNRRLFFSDKILEDGSYVRIKNVNLGYRFIKPIKGVESLNVFVNASNLHTWSNYSWFDPDVNSFAGDPASRGVDMNAYPISRTVTFGLRTVF